MLFQLPCARIIEIRFEGFFSPAPRAGPLAWKMSGLAGRTFTVAMIPASAGMLRALAVCRGLVLFQVDAYSDFMEFRPPP